MLNATLRIIAVLILLILLMLTVINQDARDTSQEYISSLAQSMDESLTLVNSTLSSIRNYLSVAEPLSDIYRYPDRDNADDLSDVFNTVQMTIAYSDIIQDMMVIAPDGSRRSFFSNLASGYIDELEKENLYDFSSSSFSDIRYFFFSKTNGVHDPSFLYAFPLISTNARLGSIRVGTVILACRLSILESILQLDLSMPYRCTMTNETGTIIVSSETDDFNTASVLQHTEISSSAIPLTIRLEAKGHYILPISPLMLFIILSILVFIGLSLLYYSRVIRHSLMLPIDQMVNAMSQISFGGTSKTLADVGIEELDIITGGINLMIGKLEEASRTATQMNTRLLETQMRNNEAELYALQSQVNPHFLFNTLQCIRSLAILHHADDISTVSGDMSSILRYSIREMDDVTIRDEMFIVRQYLNITDIRYQQRFSYDINVSDSILDCSCPCMIIQPLVENAIIHGVSATNTGGMIRIDGSRTDSEIHIEIANNGVPISKERLHELQERLNMQLFDMLSPRSKHEKSFGLLNIHRRIQLHYGDEYGLTISSGDGWTKMSLCFPAVESGEAVHTD